MLLNDINNKIGICALIFVFLISTLLSIISIEYSLWLIIYLSFIIILYFFLKKSINDKEEFMKLFYISTTAFTLRFLIVIIFTLLPELNIPSDATGYENEGLKVLNHLQRADFNFNIPASHFFYYIYNGIIFFIFGYFPSIVRIINSILGVLIGINLFFSIKKMFGTQASKTCTFLCLFFPSIVYLQSMNLKESLVVFLITLIVKGIIYSRYALSTKLIIRNLIYITLLIFTRNYAGIFMGIVFCIYILVIIKFNSTKKMLFVFGIVFIIGITTYKSGMGLFGVNVLKIYNLDTIDSIRKSEYRGGSEVLQNLSMNSIPGLIKFIPIAFLYFMFSPFPWQLSGSLLQFFSLNENILWYVLFLFLPSGIWYAFKKEKTVSILLLIILAGFSFLYSLQMGNIGLAYRMRDQLMPIFFIFISVGISEFNNKFLSRIRKVEGEECQDI